MLYEYECQNCHAIHEKTFKVSDFPKSIKCPKCGGQAKKILSKGAIMTDAKVLWMPSASDVLTRDGEQPIETRTEYRQYLKDNNLEPKA